MSRAAKIKSMLRRAVVLFLDKIDPPPPLPQRRCPSCAQVVDERALVERGDVDYCVCTACGEASVWKGQLLVAGEDSVFMPGEDD